MTKAFFNNIESKIIPYIKNAEESIFCAVGWFTNPKLLRALKEKANNIPVYLVIINDGINNKLGKLNFQEFIEEGGNFYFGNEQNLMHHKFCIIDKKIIINGSYNWTILAEKSNRENIVITDKKKIVKLFFYEFEDIISDLDKVIDIKEVANYDVEERLIKSFITQEKSAINNPTIINKPTHSIKKIANNNRASEQDKETSRKTKSVQKRKLNFFKINGKPFKAKLRWYTKDDLDLHMVLPNGKEINYKNMSVLFNEGTGKLDKDSNVNELSQNPVENITWDKLPKGEYRIYVEHFNKNEKKEVSFKVIIYANEERKVFKKKVKEGMKKIVVKFKVK